MTDKDKQIILAEIENRMENAAQYSIGAYNGMKEIRDYINSLSEEPVNKDLEEEYHEFLKREWFGKPGKTISEQMFFTAQYFAQWQKEKDDEEKVLTYKHGFEDCKEQMMKDAVETNFSALLPSCLYDSLRIKGCKEGDKLLVIKEDEL